MTLLRTNLISNIVGQGTVAILSLVFVPFYISKMGVESYALIGIFAMLQAIFATMDLGLSQTLGRESAMRMARPQTTGELLNIARTLECIYALGALIVFLLIALAAKYLTIHWLKPVELSQETVLRALWLIGLVVALRWPLTLYMGGLYGLERQLLLNSLLISFSILQNFGAFVALTLFEPTVDVFFIWQAICASGQMTVTRWFFWRSLPQGKARFSLASLRQSWHYAAGIITITILSTALTQMDKLVLSRLVDLTEFGYYVLASTAAATIYKLSLPVFNAFLPRLTQLHTLGDEEGMLNTYRIGYQLLALLLIPSALILASFSEIILLLWTNDAQLVSNTSLVFSLLVVGNTINSLMVLPYALQLAYAWTKLSIIQNIIGVAVFAPMIYIAVTLYGTVGAACAWILLNLGCIMGGVHVMHLRLLPNEKKPWLISGLFLPLAGGILGVAVSFVLPESGNSLLNILRLAAALTLTVASTALALPIIRARLVNNWRLHN